MKEKSKYRPGYVWGFVVWLGGCAPGGGVPFEDYAAASGLRFTHVNGMSGHYYFPEIQGAGAALLDYDGDGDLDVYLVQGAGLGEDSSARPVNGEPLRDRLFRNDSADGALRFTDVTASSGIDARSYGIGVAGGDYDNDGDVDLYVTNFGANQLWRNNGDGTFSDVTADSGTGDTRWSHGASFADINRDGWLDLYVANYVDYRIARHKRCVAPSGATEYCGPNSYPPQADRLYINQTDGRFRDVSGAVGLARAPAAGLGVVSADFDGNGYLDIYVANDDMPNQLWLNAGAGRLQDDALLRGVAVNNRGETEAGMGVDAGDFDGDGDLDLFITHLREETNTLYVNDGQGFFDERTISAGLAGPSIGFTGFGTAFVDYDLDGRLDIVAVNGEVRAIQRRVLQGDRYPLDQRNQLFHNEGGRFVEVAQDTPAFADEAVSRGLAVGDVDNDGDVDLLINNNNGPAQLLINRAGDGRRWLGVRALTAGGRDALGARVALLDGEGHRWWRRVGRDGSYLSSSDPRVRFGLGARAVAHIEVYWLDAPAEAWTNPAAGRYTTLVQGTGHPLPSQER